MKSISFKKVLFNIIKNSLLRHILLIALGTAIFFPAYSFYFIFPQFANQLTDYTEDAAIRVTDHLRDTVQLLKQCNDSGRYTPFIITLELKLKGRQFKSLSPFISNVIPAMKKTKY